MYTVTRESGGPALQPAMVRDTGCPAGKRLFAHRFLTLTHKQTERLCAPVFQELVGDMRARLESVGRLEVDDLEVMGEGNWSQSESPGTDAT